MCYTYHLHTLYVVEGLLILILEKGDNRYIFMEYNVIEIIFAQCQYNHEILL